VITGIGVGLFIRFAPTTSSDGKQNRSARNYFLLLGFVVLILLAWFFWREDCSLASARMEQQTLEPARHLAVVLLLVPTDREARRRS